MEEFYKEKRVLDCMMHDKNIKRSLGLEKKQSAVLDVIKNQGITKDLNKLGGYQKEKFLKSIDKQTDLGFYAKKALHEAYGTKKVEPSKPGINMKNENIERRKRYDEIMSKRNSFNKEVSKKISPKNDDSPIVNLSVSQKRIRQAEQARLLGSSGSEPSIYSKSFQQGNHSSGNEDVKSRLRSIQS